ncbi:MAG: RNA polymerase sigma-70 factor [Mycetocola sp.]
MRSHKKATPEHQDGPAQALPTRTAHRPTRLRPPSRGSADLDHAFEVFAHAEPRLFGIAYRMLGSVADAEDIVQEVWLRWQRHDRASVREPAAFLATTATRLSINVLQSARVRHEDYIGPWLPEPIDTSENPELTVERGETLEIAVLYLLERLTPAERAAYVLREAFAYPYDRIAAIVESTEANARQLVSRARKHLESHRQAPVAATEQRRFLAAFLEAAQAGNLAALESLFTEDVISYSDGGGVVHAARFPIAGRTRVAKFMAAVSEWFWDDIEVTWIEANGSPALRFDIDGDTFGMFTLSVSDGGIDRLFWMLNPAKLDAILPLVPSPRS